MPFDREPTDRASRPLWALLGLMALLVAVCVGCGIAPFAPLVGP